MKVVIVTRNPLDACISSYYHSFNPFKSGWPFDAWASTWLAGYAMYGSYFDWVKGWHEELQRYPDKAIWIQYEDLKEDAVRETSRLARYLGVEQANDDAFIQKVIEYSSFETMVKQAEEKGGDTIGHLRKGKVGDWKNHFSADLFAEFQQTMIQELVDIPVRSQFEL
jgi:hypothetical protein